MVKFIDRIMAKIYDSNGFIRLARLKIFQQVLIIMVVMILFLAGQGYSGIRVMNNLQETTQVVYNETANKLNEITQLKLNVEQLKLIYAEIMAGQDLGKNIPLISEQLNRVKSKVSYLEGMEQPAREKVKEKLDAIGEIIGQTPGPDGYEQLKQNIREINLYIDNAYSMVFNTTLATISHNEKYTSESQRNTIVIILVSTLIAGLVGLTIVTTITGPLKVMESAAQSLAVGDLSKNIKAIGCPEIMRAIKGLNKAIDGLSRLVNGINEQASVLFIASKELKEATTETGLSASQIAKTMEELARASTEQAAQVNHAVNTIHLLSDMVVKVSNEMESIAAASGRVAQSAKAGQKATNDVANEINELYNSTKEVAGVIDELNETSVKISEITSVIHNIAEQTTLLALNASIEAARAGEHGRGFGVVASETGKLADQSKQAANLIADLVGEMKTRTEHAVEVMSSSTRRAELGKNLATEATVTFEGIFNTLQNTLDEIEAVAVSARQMAQSNEEVMDAIATIAQISEESAAGTEEVSATAEEQNASVEQLIALAENLNQVANNLSQSVAQFQLE